MRLLHGIPLKNNTYICLEAVQRSDIRFVCSDYSRFCSVTSMHQSLGWDTLEVRRHLSAVTMIFKAVHNLNRLTLPASVNLVHSGTRSNHPYKFSHIFAHSNAYERDVVFIKDLLKENGNYLSFQEFS